MQAWAEGGNLFNEIERAALAWAESVTRVAEGRGIMDGGAMGPPIMFRMMFALMDNDGDGTVSL